MSFGHWWITFTQAFVCVSVPMILGDICVVNRVGLQMLQLTGHQQCTMERMDGRTACILNRRAIGSSSSRLCISAAVALV